jgi:ribosome biogenesis GTPase / thiamine phosphate phosphatase
VTVPWSTDVPSPVALRRRDPDKGVEQLLAANVDVVGVVCGLDRPVKDGRIQRADPAGARRRGRAARGAHQGRPDRRRRSVVADVEAGSPGVEVVVRVGPRGPGHRRPRRRPSTGSTAVLIGESGAGKSTLVNL